MKNIEDLLICKKLSGRELDDLKQFFESQIHSRRKLSLIHSINDLLEVLHSLDICNEFDISAYKKIADKLEDLKLLRALDNHKTVRRMPGVNLYALQRISEKDQEKILLLEQLSIKKNKDLDSYNGHLIKSPDSFTSDTLGHRKKLIYREINDGIGGQWRPFGRELNIPEGIMDQFNERPDTRVMKVLERFENDPKRQKNNFIFDLTQALTRCRRRDLAKAIEKILTNN